LRQHHKIDTGIFGDSLLKQQGSLDHFQIEVLSTVYLTEENSIFLPHSYNMVEIEIRKGG
jgi:hypothetical protein